MEAESGGKWRFRVRGPPWDLKIVKKEKPTETEGKNEGQEEKMNVEVNQENEERE